MFHFSPHISRVRMLMGGCTLPVQYVSEYVEHHRLPPPDKHKRSHFKLCRGRPSIHLPHLITAWQLTGRIASLTASQASPHLIVGREGCWPLVGGV